MTTRLFLTCALLSALLLLLALAFGDFPRGVAILMVCGWLVGLLVATFAFVVHVIQADARARWQAHLGQQSRLAQLGR